MALARAQQAQADAAAQRIRARGHRLEADELTAQRRVELCARVALEELERDAAAAAGDAESRRFGDRVEAIVELALGELKRRARACLPGADRYLLGVEGEIAHRRQLHEPVLAGNPRQREVGVKAERDRHDVLAAGADRDRDVKRASRSDAWYSRSWRNGKTSNNAGCMVLQLSRALERLRAGGARELPGDATADHAVDRQAVVVVRDQRRVIRHRHRPPSDAVVERGETIGPRIQQRDAHRLAALRVGPEAGVLGEQLIAAVAQRRADHAAVRRQMPPRAQTAGSDRQALATGVSLIARLLLGRFPSARRSSQDREGVCR